MKHSLESEERSGPAFNDAGALFTCSKLKLDSLFLQFISLPRTQDSVSLGEGNTCLTTERKQRNRKEIIQDH